MNLPLASLLRLSKFMNVSSDAITVPMVVEIADVLGHKLEPDSVHLQDVVDAMRENDVSRLSDVIARPELFPKVMSIFGPKPSGIVETQATRLCPVCETLLSIPLGPKERAEQTAFAACPTCDARYVLTPTGLLPRE